MGTNAFALAALEHLPVQVSGAEHYRQALHPLSVAAAPVWDSQGHLRGVIGLCGSASQNHPHTLALIVTIGQLVQEYLADHAGPSPLLRNERGTPPHLLRGMMLVNRDGEVTHLDSEGCRLLDMEQGELVGTALRRWIVAPEGLVRSLQAGQTMREIEVRFRTLNGILTLLMTCEPVAGPDGELRGSSCTFMPMDRVTRLVTRFSGALARINFNDILGNSRLIQATVERARQAARGQEPILLIGEAGSGKLLFAQAIHAASIRRDGPFVNFDCGAFSCFSPDFLLVDLMGTAPSPEDGACRGQPSKFELAADGTLFLDRVESLTPRAQRTLLSVLSSRRVWRVGSQRAELLRARIIAASDTNLHQEVEEGRFLGELLAQFAGNIITVPPLRERREDIGPLVERFVFEFGRQLDKELVVCQPALDALVRYAWPGNITELRSVLGRAAQLAQEGIIELHHLPARIQQQIDPRLPLAHGERPMSIEEAERYAIIQAGWAMSGNVQQMANALGIGRTTLWRKLKALQLSPDHFRRAPEA
jgi:transcriptional activator for dhaKLM operon